MIPDGAIASGVISKIINDLADISKSKIKKAVEDKKNEHKSLESQLYNLIVSVLNEMNDNSYEKNSDKIYDTAEKLLIGFQKYGREDEEAVRFALKNILSCVDDYKCMEFKTLLIHEISKDEYNEFYHEIRLLQEEKEYKKTDRIEQKVDHLDQKLDDIRKSDERIIRNSDKAVKFQKNKKQDYIKNWNNRMFLHQDNDKNPITLADAFIIPNFKVHKSVKRMEFLDDDTLDKIIEKFVEYDKTTTMLITGVPGIGKSSITSWIANKYRNDDRFIILRFRDWKRSELDNGLLSCICKVLRCENEELEHRILILDGYDEMKSLEKRKHLINVFINDLNDYKDLKCIITSRPAYISFCSRCFQNVVELKEFDIQKIDTFCKTIIGKSLDKKEKVEANLEVLGIPVILYMAIMSGIDISENPTKPELYNRIFAEEGGIFDKFSVDGVEYSPGTQILRNPENIKKYLKFLKDTAFKMFEKDSLSLYKEECQVPAMEFQGESVSIMEFPIKHLFESMESDNNIEFIHKSIYEYFVSEYMFSSIFKYENMEKEILAGVLGKLFIKNQINDEVIEFLKYKIRNSKWNIYFDKFNETFQLMLKDGMTFYTKKQYKNIIQCVSNVFKNMLDIIHLWENAFFKFDNLIHDYLRFDIEQLNFSKTDLRGLNLKKSDLVRANLTGADLTGANLIGARLVDAKLDDACLLNTIFDEMQVIDIKCKYDLRESMVFVAEIKSVIQYKEFVAKKFNCI